MCRTNLPPEPQRPGKCWGVVLHAGMILALVAGCGGPKLYPVEGVVTLEDGKPMPSGMVSFEMHEGEKMVMARATIEKDGSYRLSTHKPGDGAMQGKYRVLVAPPPAYSGDPPPDAPPRVDIDARFQSYETSGLTFEVKPEKNQYPIKVARPGKPPR